MVQLRPWQLRDFIVCSLQYRLKHVDHRPRSAALTSPALALGNSLHAALAEWHRPDRVGQIGPEELLARHWSGDGYANVQGRGQYFALGVHVLERYLAATPHQQGQVLATEAYLARTVSSGDVRVELTGRADRITRLPSGALEILDYKANADGLVPLRDTLAHDLPTFVYYLLARVMYPQHTQVIVAQLNLFTLNKTTVDYTAAERAENKAQLFAVVSEIERQAFAPRLGAHCAWCPVRAYCPAFGPEVTLDPV